MAPRAQTAITSLRQPVLQTAAPALITHFPRTSARHTSTTIMATKKPSKKVITAMSTATIPSTPAPDLTKPFSWRNPAYQPFLERLQGNILKGHGRHHTMNLFFTVQPGKAAEARITLKLLATQYATSALKQLKETDDFKEARAKGEDFHSDPFLSILLSHEGYLKLGPLPGTTPSDGQFIAGMRGSQGTLNDPPTAAWDNDFKILPHGFIMIADVSPVAVDTITGKIVSISAHSLTFTARQRGKAILNSRDEGLEHFGYVDGRSQPLFLQEDLETERGNAGTTMWDPAFSPQRLVIPDPGAPLDKHAFGSYFIFRKLEEDVRGFKRREQEIATALHFTGEDRERAGALAIGRFEDGTPVTLSPDAIEPAHGRVPNDFNYDEDKTAGKCPFHAHIRKVNPRGSSIAGATDRDAIMARRGITYEDVPRTIHPDALPTPEDLADFDIRVGPFLPADKVGLLFMAYNVSIRGQFERTQKTWSNDPDFPIAAPSVPPTGIDPVIGQPGTGPTANPDPSWPQEFTSGASPVTPFGFSGFVKMLGGDYFFAPSLSFLRGL